VAEYATFREFVEHLVLPMREAHPDHKRLDGQPSGGNRTVAGTFWHRGRRWKVHADTHYRQLLIAYEALRSGEVPDPFVEKATKNGISLDLAPSLRARTGDREKYSTSTAEAEDSRVADQLMLVQFPHPGGQHVPQGS
jgi:hypothetical protein